MNPQGVFGIRTLADVRALFYVLAPLLTGALVTWGVVDQQRGALWAAAATALFAPVLAASNTADKVRLWLYRALAVVSPLLVAYDIFTTDQISSVAAIFTTLLGAGVAAANTPVSLDEGSVK
jgi:hypothetical protein